MLNVHNTPHRPEFIWVSKIVYGLLPQSKLNVASLFKISSNFISGTCDLTKTFFIEEMWPRAAASEPR